MFPNQCLGTYAKNEARGPSQRPSEALRGHAEYNRGVSIVKWSDVVNRCNITSYEYGAIWFNVKLQLAQKWMDVWGRIQIWNCAKNDRRGLLLRDYSHKYTVISYRFT